MDSLNHLAENAKVPLQEGGWRVGCGDLALESNRPNFWINSCSSFSLLVPCSALFTMCVFVCVSSHREPANCCERLGHLFFKYLGHLKGHAYAVNVEGVTYIHHTHSFSCQTNQQCQVCNYSECL